MSNTVLDAAYHLVHDYPGGSVALAGRLGKNPATLSHEVAGSGTAKLSLVDAVKISHFTGSRNVLNAFAAQLGCMVLPLPTHQAGVDTFHQLAATAREFSEFVGSVADAAADAHITANELARVDRTLGELVAAAQDIRATLAELHESGKPAHIRRAA